MEPLDKSRIPNIITIFRIILVFPMLYALVKGYYYSTFALFVVAGISDAFDGYLARHFGWTSRFGSIADPLADKLLLIVSFAGLAYIAKIPWWLFWLVMARDMWIIIGGLVYHYFVGYLNMMSPSWISKANTFFQIVFVALQFYELAFHVIPVTIMKWMMDIMVITIIASFIDYTIVWGLRALRYWLRR